MLPSLSPEPDLQEVEMALSDDEPILTSKAQKQNRQRKKLKKKRKNLAQERADSMRFVSLHGQKEDFTMKNVDKWLKNFISVKAIRFIPEKNLLEFENKDEVVAFLKEREENMETFGNLFQTTKYGSSSGRKSEKSIRANSRRCVHLFRSERGPKITLKNLYKWLRNFDSAPLIPTILKEGSSFLMEFGNVEKVQEFLMEWKENIATFGGKFNVMEEYDHFYWCKGRSSGEIILPYSRKAKKRHMLKWKRDEAFSKNEVSGMKSKIDKNEKGEKKKRKRSKSAKRKKRKRSEKKEYVSIYLQ